MLNQEQIKEIIPHRAPFLLVDEVTELEPGVRAVGKLFLAPDNPVFKGHFPGNPVFPGVLMVEALAQVGAIIVLSLPEHKGKIGLLGGLKKARFRRVVVPGETLTLEVELSKVRGPMGVGMARAHVNGELACTGEITFAIK